MNTNPKIKNIWKTYRVIRDSFKVTTRSVEQNNIALLKKTNFFNQEKDIVTQDIKTCRNAADDYVILALWAVFERHILETIIQESNKLLDEEPSSFNRSVHAKVTDAIEYLKLTELLDLLKPLVGSDLVGQAKNIKKHRDWLAHRNPKKPSPGNVAPGVVYRVLSEIVNILDTYDSSSSYMSNQARKF